MVFIIIILKVEPEIVRENVLFSTKAEGLHLSVAAASIIARVAFLEEMDRLSGIAGMTLPKGAGPKVDEVAAKILLKSGEDTLKSMTKWHFANAGKAKGYCSKEKKVSFTPRMLFKLVNSKGQLDQVLTSNLRFRKNLSNKLPR